MIKVKTSWRIESPSIDSKLKHRRKVPAKNDMQSLEGREREIEKKKMKKKKGALSMYTLEHNDACSITVNKVDRDSESMPGS